MRWVTPLLICLGGIAHTHAQSNPIDLFIAQAKRTNTSFAHTAYPFNTHMSGQYTGLNTWVTAGAGGWTSGFFPGILWQLYHITRDMQWHTAAASWTEGIRSQQFNTGTHDVGFMVFNSFGMGYLLGDMGDNYKQVIFNAARSLASRFNTNVGCTQSWGAGAHCREDSSYRTNFPVIIDNMMNLELLLWTSQNGGNASYYDIAVSHARHTMRNHIRADGSTYHVVDYDPVSGAVKKRCTAQGYHDETAWSRGQAWCTYGFTMVFRFTKDAEFLRTAQTCADYFVSHLQPDNVPLWDFQWDGATGLHYRDSSAAAIVASALIELDSYAPGRNYKATAQKIVSALLSPSYLGEYSQTQGIVLHSTGSYVPNSQVDVTLVYGDYYLLEALRRLG